MNFPPVELRTPHSPSESISKREMADATESEAERRLSGKIHRILDESRQSQALHNRKLKELASLHRSSPPDLFFRSFVGALAPLFDFPRRTICAERSVRFVASFVSLVCGKIGGAIDPENPFLEQFLRLLLLGACSTHRPTRFRSCQIISEVNLHCYHQISTELKMLISVMFADYHAIAGRC